jgi:hypothetical protein
MARPQEEGLKYFPVDAGFFSDKKIKILKARFGSDGIVLYMYYLCLIYGDKGYYLKVDDDLDFVTKEDLGMSLQKIAQIRKFLLERSLLDSKLFQSDTILTARSIQDRFQSAKKKLNRPTDVIARYWLLDKTKTDTCIKLHGSKDNSEINPDKSKINKNKSEINSLKERKGKEIDDDDTVTIFSSQDSPGREDAIQYFTDIFFKPNDVQLTWLDGYIDKYGIDNFYEAIEETGRRNVNNPVAYMQKVLRTLELEDMPE